MSEPIVKYAVAPRLSMNDPDCSACAVSVESTGDGWECPTCGTAWDYSDGEDDCGQLFEEWSGEELDLELTDPDDAWEVTIPAERKRRATEYAAIVNRIATAKESRGAE